MNETSSQSSSIPQEAASAKTSQAAMAVASMVAATISFTPHLPHIPVGARLRFFALAWATLIMDPWTTSVVTHGYYPELTGETMLGRGPMTVDRCRLDPVRELARTTMVMEMLQEEVIEPVGSPLTLFSDEPDRGYWPVLPSIFSTYFLVPKSDGGWRGCLDSRFMNQYVQGIYFKMDSLRTLRDMAMPGDYMVKLDLRHAYLVCPIHPRARPAFRFRAAGDWQFRSVCFGLRSAPRVFTRLLKPVFARLRQLGIRLVVFIDDVAILARTPLEAVQHGQKVVELLLALGFIVHKIKSDLVPRQSDGEFLGAIVDLRPEVMCFRLPGKKRRALKSSCRKLLLASKPLSPRELSRVLGTMVSTRLMVSQAALNSRGLERDLKQALISSNGEWDVHCWNLSTEAIENLIWWVELLGQPTKCQMFLTEHEVTIDTDASPWGFGGFLGSMATGGFWGLQERDFSQNGRELRAVELTLQTFVKWLRGRSVLVLTDSAVVCCYLNRQGGRFATLSRVAERVLHWASRERIAIRCTHLPGVLNTRADVRSRWAETVSEFRLAPHVLCGALWALQTPMPTVDLFASRHNRQCRKYFSMRLEPETHGVNGLSQTWSPHEVLYAFPPIPLLMQVLRRVRREGIRMILVTPSYGGAWFPLVLAMATQPPVMLPADEIYLGLDGTFRTSPRFRTLVWTIQGHQPPELPPSLLLPVPWRPMPTRNG